jgi:ketose-bisphosphate aldolase
MMDGSLGTDGKTPSTYEYNVDTTRHVVELAHACGVSVEGELGCLGSLETGKAGEEDGHGAEGVLDHSALLTDPNEAADFVSKTHVDALAIAIGTSHGAYKFTQKPTGKVLRIDRVKEIHQRIPSVHLVMHGSSSVPEDWLAIINSYGGDMGQTYGVPVSEIVEGIKNGVRKVNIDTDLRMASTGAIRKHLAENKANFDPRKFLKEATKAMSGICSGPLRSLRRRRPGQQDRQGLQPGRHAEALRQGRAGSQGQLTRRAIQTRARFTSTLAVTFGGGYRRPFLFCGPHHDRRPVRTSIQSLPLIHKGKVRDIYAIDDQRMLIVTTDRLSAFDVILPTPIPGKGKVLTAVADFWFAKLATFCPTN